MENIESNQIAEDAKQKIRSLRSPYPYGLIFLFSIAAGLLFSQFGVFASDVNSQEESSLRFGIGVYLGLKIAMPIAFLYFAWTVFRMRRVYKQTEARLFQHHMEKVQRPDER